MKKHLLPLLTFTLLFPHILLSANQASEPTIEFLKSANAATNELPFSAGVRVGDILYLSGQLGMDTATGKLVNGGITAEAKQAMDNIKALLQAHGYTMSDIIKCTVMMADISEWQSFNDVYLSYFTRPYPARSAFGSSGLGLNARVEVECMAAHGQRRPADS